MHVEHMGIDWDGPIACDLDSTVQVDVLISEINFVPKSIL